LPTLGRVWNCLVLKNVDEDFKKYPLSVRLNISVVDDCSYGDDDDVDDDDDGSTHRLEAYYSACTTVNGRWVQ